MLATCRLGFMFTSLRGSSGSSGSSVVVIVVVVLLMLVLLELLVQQLQLRTPVEIVEITVGNRLFGNCFLGAKEESNGCPLSQGALPAVSSQKMIS